MIFLIGLSLTYLSTLLIYSPTEPLKVNTEPHMSGSLETDYTPINLDGIQPVGNITIETINSLGEGVMETTSVGINPQNITFTYLGYEWLGIQQIAFAESHSTEYYVGNIEIRLNETVQFHYYANDTLTLLNYKPELNRGELISMTINSTPIDVEEVEISQFGGFNYNYSSYHNINPEDTLVVSYLYDYNVTIRNWRLLQKRYPTSPIESPFINLYQHTNFESYYNYTFQFGNFNVDLDVDVLVNIPDVDYLYDFFWQKRYNLTTTLEFEDVIQLSNGTFRLNNIPVDSKSYIVDFLTNHTVELTNQFSEYWRRDYLTDGKTTRVRDFDITVVEGPPTILVSNFRLNMTEFNFEEVLEVTSGFDRRIATFNLRDIGNRTQNGTRIDFLGGEELLASDYYLVLNEVDTISIKYDAPASLTIQVVDKINVPLKNAEVKLNFGNSTNATYGTFISEDFSLPYAYKISNSLGFVYYPDVPRGNYTVEVFYQNKLVADGVSIDTTSEINVILTSVPHFPTWMIIFASTSAIIGTVGYVIFKKAKS